jgi:predicted transcriptional regulator YdeE
MVDEQAIHFYVVVSASDSGTLDFIQDQWNNCYNHPFASAYHRSFERIDYAI